MKATRHYRSGRVPTGLPIAQHKNLSTEPEQPACADLQVTHLYGGYVAYLRDDRGLARNSILVYTIHIRNYLQSQDSGSGQVTPQAFNATTMRNHIIAHGKGRSGEYVRLMAVSLRSFCHFLFLYSLTSVDVSESIPMVRTWRQSSVPNYLTPEQVERILAATDCSCRIGCRDYAILLLLARLGLRAGEIVTLTLDDIRWRSGEIVIHGKGGQIERIPLLSDVGEAIAHYMRDFREDSASRQIFLSDWLPHVGLSGPATIGHIVRRAFARIGFLPTSRGASHLFRHGLATTMIRQGASMAQIAQVMRHRSQNSTAIYAKVAFEDLRAVARPWPTMGGA